MIWVRIGKTVKSGVEPSRPETEGDTVLSNEKTENDETKGKLSRRDFLKYSAGVAAVAAGAAAMMDKIPFSSSQPAKTPVAASSGEPMVVAVHGDLLTVISGERSVRVKDPALAAMLAGRAETED